MKKKILILITLIMVIVLGVTTIPEKVSADELSDNIQSELDNLDLEELQDFYDGIMNGKDKDFNTVLGNILGGEYYSDYGSVADYIIKIIFDDIFKMLPMFLSVIAIALLCGIVQSVKSTFLSEGVSEIIFFVCVLSIVLILSAEMLSIWNTAKNIIENISILNEIMSPIILTLMVASGGKVSASVYKPTVTFLTGGIINIIVYAVFPLIGLMIVFSVINCFSGSVKLSKFSEFITGTVKWIIGISFTVYGLFLSVQGISSATFDGISIKAAKYAISNSIPIIGGYLKDGFDLMVAGSVLIKNAVGVVGVIALFYVILSPVIHMAVVSLLLKLTAAFSEPLSDSNVSNLCMGFSKGVTYITVAMLAVGFMLFITILLMIFSANAFI